MIGRLLCRLFGHPPLKPGAIFGTCRRCGELRQARPQLPPITISATRLFGRPEEIMTGQTYATGKPFPPRHEWVPRVFRRADSFYIIDLPEDDDVAEHAALNPGTVRVEDVLGNQLWPPAPSVVGENS